LTSPREVSVRLLPRRRTGTPPKRHVLVEGDDIVGDGVNIAARLEGIAEPGGICISEDAFRQVRVKIEAEFADIGEQSLKKHCPATARLPRRPVTFSDGEFGNWLGAILRQWRSCCQRLPGDRWGSRRAGALRCPLGTQSVVRPSKWLSSGYSEFRKG
jgi:hypothetical protein